MISPRFISDKRTVDTCSSTTFPITYFFMRISILVGHNRLQLQGHTGFNLGNRREYLQRSHFPFGQNPKFCSVCQVFITNRHHTFAFADRSEDASGIDGCISVGNIPYKAALRSKLKSVLVGQQGFQLNRFTDIGYRAVRQTDLHIACYGVFITGFSIYFHFVQTWTILRTSCHTVNAHIVTGYIGKRNVACSSRWCRFLINGFPSHFIVRHFHTIVRSIGILIPMQHNTVKHIRHFQINGNELIIVESATPTSRQITIVDKFG